MRYGGIYIKSLVPGGAAEQDGRIQIGNLFINHFNILSGGCQVTKLCKSWKAEKCVESKNLESKTNFPMWIIKCIISYCVVFDAGCLLNF